MAEDTKPKLKAREITVSEFKKSLTNILKTNITPFVWGPPGVGKSSVVKEVAAEGGWKIIDLRLSLLNPVDLRGLPTIDREKNQANWLPPSFLPAEDTKEKGILFLDEINLAPLSVQAAAYQLILDKQIGDYKFPKTWRIVAAGNRETDKANVFKISAPLANRFIHFTVRPDFYEWKNWAEQKSIHPNVIHFLTMRPSAIFDPPAEQEKAFPSPRSWQFVAEMLETFEYDESEDVPRDLIQVVMGAVGEGTGREFIEHINSNKLQDINDRLARFIETGVIKMPKSISQRLTLIAAVFEAFAAGQIDQTRYDGFKSNLNAEETKAIEEFEKENADRIEAKFKNPKRMPGGVKTTIRDDLSANALETIQCQDVSKFGDTGTILLISPDGKTQEVVGYAERGLATNTLEVLTRNAGASFDFPAGSTINKLS